MQTLTKLESYQLAKAQYSNTCLIENRYLTTLNYLKELNKAQGLEIDDISNRIKIMRETNQNLMNSYKELVDSYEFDQREFSVLVLVSENKRVYISKRIDITKDYYNHYQATGGRKEINETYEECAIREAKEEADVNIDKDKIIYVNICEGFRTFPDGKEILYKTVIYFANIGDQAPKRMEPEKNEIWISVELKDLENYQLTNSLQENKKKLIEMINNRIKLNSRKRKRPNKEISETNGATTPEGSVKLDDNDISNVEIE